MNDQDAIQLEKLVLRVGLSPIVEQLAANARALAIENQQISRSRAAEAVRTSACRRAHAWDHAATVLDQANKDIHI